MDRSEILQMMAALQLSGMRAAYDEIVTAGIKRKHSVDQIIAALLKAEIAEKQARSIRYQMGVAKLPLAKELADFVFKGTPINEQLVRDLAGGNFLSQQRNVVAVGGTGTGKSHIAIGITRSCIRLGRKARYFNAVDLVNQLEAETKAGRGGRLAEKLTRIRGVQADPVQADWALWQPGESHSRVAGTASRSYSSPFAAVATSCWYVAWIWLPWGSVMRSSSQLAM